MTDPLIIASRDRWAMKQVGDWDVAHYLGPYINSKGKAIGASYQVRCACGARFRARSNLLARKADGRIGPGCLTCNDGKREVSL